VLVPVLAELDYMLYLLADGLTVFCSILDVVWLPGRIFVFFYT